METPTPTRKDLRRESILAVAAEVFAEEGYQAASMSSIAARLGGSKGTLYNYFGSKEALFEAHIRESCGRIAADILDFVDDQPVGEVLQRLGERFLDQILSDQSVRLFQIVVAEARRTPELARLFFESGPQVGRERIGRYLKEAQARGEIDADDCDEAAWIFLATCRAHHLEAVLNLRPKPSPEEIRAQVARAVEMFMARYARD
ncbi:MAG TPA: TetR/AcrR family transcriptional regulator [Caulobacteraceae bacterium]|jgi:AcrR family transcriptional regulator